MIFKIQSKPFECIVCNHSNIEETMNFIGKDEPYIKKNIPDGNYVMRRIVPDQNYDFGTYEFEHAPKSFIDDFFNILPVPVIKD